MAPNTWLFQAKPEIYDLIEELKNIEIGDEGFWDVTRYKDEIKPSDKVILWVSGKQAGVYALGEVTEKPRDERGETVVDFRLYSYFESPCTS